MTVVFISNFLTPHQVPFCQEMVRLLDGDFVFLATTPFRSHEVSTGFHDMNLEYDFCLPVYMSEDNNKKALQLVEQCDIVLLGGLDISLIKRRLLKNKITFCMTERLFKTWLRGIHKYRTIFSIMRNRKYFQKQSLFLLASGSYVTKDYAKLAIFQHKAFKWGYFPEVPPELKRVELHPEMLLELTWVGRVIDLKQPMQPILFAEFLLQNQIPFQLNFIGEGDQLLNIQNVVKKKGLSNNVKFLGTLPSEEVHKQMCSTDIYLFTSNQDEGWGAVLNEAMAAGCAVIASKLAGATTYLIRHKYNGIIYDGTIEDLIKQGNIMINDRLLCNRLGAAAYDTMRELWNAPVAAKRLIELCDGLMNGYIPEFTDGPCSQA